MTYLQIIETIQELFPDRPRTQVKKDINEVYRDFCHRTRIATTTDQQAITTTTVTYSLPADCDRAYAVVFYDTDDGILTGSSTLQYEIEQGEINFKSYTNGIITTISSGISYYVLHYVQVPTALSSDSDIPAIDSQFHEALVEGVLAKYFRRYPSLDKILNDGNIMKVRDFNAGNHARKEYEELVRKGKKYANANQDDTNYSVAYHEV